MKKQDFTFDLPEKLIAQCPLPNRSDSRLLIYCRKTKTHQHCLFKDLANYLEPGDLLVMNDSRVIPARLYGKKESGGKVELLIERLLPENAFLAHIRASKAPKPGCMIVLEQDKRIEVLGREGDLFYCRSLSHLSTILDEQGHIPLPLYITRQDDSQDKDRYQTVYAREKGSVAAPTAGLHFDEDVLQRLRVRGINLAYVTLHVGAGTFQPVRVDNVDEHIMHHERFRVSESLCELIRHTKAQNKRVIAVGTTSLRSLESAASGGALTACEGETDIFIKPGYTFQVCDGLLTNFHLPESTLLMLVSAFIGHREAMDLYQVAIAACYRFYSYGDASLLL